MDIEDNTSKVEVEFDKKIDALLSIIGKGCMDACVDKTNEIDSATGRPTVDTGRYRAGWGYITPTEGKMSGTPIVRIDEDNPVEESDDISSQRADANTVVIANNVPYASDLEFGFGTQKGGMHARWILKRAVEESMSGIEHFAEKVLSSDDDIIVEFSGKGE